MTILGNLKQFASQVALQDQEGATLTYTELFQKTKDYSAKLPSSRQLVFIKCSNTIDTVIAYVATLESGHVALMLDENLDEELLTNLTNLYRPNGIWEYATDIDNKHFHYREYHQQSHQMHPDLCLLLSTSGSTGSPKLVRLTQKNLRSNAKSIVHYLKLDASEIPMVNLPLHYSYGLSIINSHLLVGAKIILTNHSIVSNDFWSLFKKNEATSISGVPYSYEILQLARIENMDLPSLRYMTQAGGKLKAEIAKRFIEIAEQKGVRFYTMYGQTEATARISWLPPEWAVEKTGSIGIPIPDGKMLLEDTLGEQLIDTPETEGELVYYGENVMMGYAESIENLRLGDQLKGKLRTGDIAKYDTDGFFYITGRLKRFIKILGNRVNLEEIENNLTAQGFNCYCLGKENQLVVASLNDNANEIRTLIIDQYHFHLSMVKVFKIKKIPRSPSGKILYTALYDQYCERRAN